MAMTPLHRNLTNRRGYIVTVAQPGISQSVVRIGGGGSEPQSGRQSDQQPQVCASADARELQHRGCMLV